MLTNEQMTAGRFLRLFKARKMYRDIIGHLAKGGRVQVSTHLRSVVYSSPTQFKPGKRSVYAARGKNWVDISFCGVRFIA